jgi:hypothetical protein
MSDPPRLATSRALSSSAVKLTNPPRSYSPSPRSISAPVRGSCGRRLTRVGAIPSVAVSSRLSSPIERAAGRSGSSPSSAP